ncbi:MAG TPA: thiamine phosphate synthase [Terriglobales bacterium]|jgi:thiamine-phosphate pyrophosphorylase|nr:thiamine phosphate synthase [Terriglobales bacterium]
MNAPRATQLLPAGPLPRLYAIVDAADFPEEDPARQARLAAFAADLLAGGATLLQYRNKAGSGRRLLDDARALRRLTGGKARLILNDRADLCLAAECEGVHLGQEDLSPEGARRILGDRLWVGVSTHSAEQAREAERAPVDYLAVGPVFATASKERPDPVIGLEGVRAARLATRKPLVAIGGITRANCRSVIEAGADSVAVIADLRLQPRQAVEEFLRILS